MNLLVTDFDGTLYDEKYDKNIDLLNKCKENIKICIATGRNYPSLKKDLKIKCDYYICNDGGYILDKDENLLYRNSIDENYIKIIYNRIQKLNKKGYFFDNIDEFSKDIIKNINKVSVKITNREKALDELNYLTKDMNLYSYLSENWINILNINSTKDKAIDLLTRINHFDNIIVVGNEINDFEMLNKYNGYLITNENNKNFNCINSFLDIEDKIKK